MTEITNKELSEALRAIEGLPLGARLIVRAAAERLAEGADGDWIEWDGSGYSDDDKWAAPVLTGTMLDVKYRDGETIYGIPAGEITDHDRYAYGAYWENEGAANDIVAYRLA